MYFYETRGPRPPPAGAENEIPVKIVKELVPDGYALMMISTIN